MSISRLLVVLCVFLLISSACSSAHQTPEMRVLWVERWDITSPEACQRIVDAAKKNNFNTLVVQVRGRADAFYNSHFEPRAQDLDDQPLGYDPLATILAAAHKSGLQVHAWLNANFVWGSRRMPHSPDHILNAHSYWMMRNKSNEVVLQSTENYDGGFACPNHPGYVAHLRDVYLDVVKNYDVDGISFDFIRYPDSNFCYCDWCLATFKAEMKAKIKPEEKAALDQSPDRLAYVKAYPQAYDDFRRERVTREVYTIHDAVKAVKPNIILSASVFPKAEEAYNGRLQDWKRWLREGKLDLLFPMAYVKTGKTFDAYISDAIRSSNGVPVCPNIGSYLITADSTVEKINQARKLGAIGSGVYCWAITDDGKDLSYLQTVKDKVWQEPVPVPRLLSPAQ